MKRILFLPVAVLALLLLLSTGKVHPSKPGPALVSDSLQTVEGQVVCISEEMAKLRHTKPMCKKYGHLLGLKLSDGTIWSFFLNPVGREIRNNQQLLGKRLKVYGRLFYDAKIIEVVRYEVLDAEETKKGGRKD